MQNIIKRRRHHLCGVLWYRCSVSLGPIDEVIKYSTGILSTFLDYTNTHQGYCKNYGKFLITKTYQLEFHPNSINKDGAKESKSSGGQIIHFGHCKCMAQDNSLSELEASFLSIPLQSGYPYEYWKKGVDCTLVKKSNSY